MLINKLQNELKQHHSTEKDWLFSDNWFESGFINEELSKYLEDQLNNINSGFVDILEDLSWYSLERIQYVLNQSNNPEELLSQYCQYAYLTIAKGNDACGCLELNPNLSMHRTGILFSSLIAGNLWHEAEKVGLALIDSLNAKKCIIRRGDVNAHVAWFTIALYSKVTNQDINKEIARYPKKINPYDSILDSWNTTDLVAVDKMVCLLSDVHVEPALTSGLDNDEKIDNLELPFILLFPYEILAWLAIREKHGLKNPKKYSHPLMNTPIAKFFLNLETPLEKPKDLPYAKELLEKLKEKCPDIEIPDWL